MGETDQPPPPQPTQLPPMARALPPLPTSATGNGIIHPPTEQLTTLHYCVHSNPGWLALVLLAFEHYIVMLGTIVLFASIVVPQMGGTHKDKAEVIQTFLFMSGINTLLQTLIGTRLPTVMNVSFAFMVPVMSIINDFAQKPYDSEHERFIHTMKAIQGALLISSTINIVMGYTRVWGRLMRFFSPVSVAPVVCVVGLGLFGRGFPQVGKCVELGVPTLILLVVVQQYMKNIYQRTRVQFERFSLIFCIKLVWAFAAILTVAGAYKNVPERTKLHCRTDRSYLISSAPWIRVPYPFQWGTPIFTASHVFGMMGAVIVSAVESTGAHYAAARLAGATPPPTHVLSRSVGLQGVGMFLEGIFGAPAGSTASVEIVGLVGLTRIGSRRIVELSTAFMFFFSIFGKFGAFFASIPLPIFAAVYCVLFGLVSAVGISFLQFTNNNSMRNMYIVGLSLFLAISIPQYFNEYTGNAKHGPANTNAGWFNDLVNTIFSSAPTVALIVGLLLDNTLETTNAYGERGLSWWLHFQNRRGDLRSEEFYSYPLKVNALIPPRYMY